MPARSPAVSILVGTQRAAFLYTSTDGRRTWQAEGPLMEDWQVDFITADPRNGRLLAAANSPFYGAVVRRSKDGGRTWDQGGLGLSYPAGEDDLKEVWQVVAAGPERPHRLYAGVAPTGLFVSDDDGDHWAERPALRQAARLPQGAAGRRVECLHSLVPDPFRPDRLFAACASGGVFRSDDAGERWHKVLDMARTHKLCASPSRPRRLYLQAIDRVFRTDDGGDHWQEIGLGDSEGLSPAGIGGDSADSRGTPQAQLPSTFGFPIATPPGQPDTVFVVPLDRATRRFAGGRAAVYRSDDAGHSWLPGSSGLPQPAHVGVLRHALATDTLDPPGVYLGTTSGGLYASADGGRSWATVAEHLPRILSVGIVSQQ